MTVVGVVLAAPGAAYAGARSAPKDGRIIAAARSAIGTPYSYGGASPSGTDCSGFTMWLFARFGVSLPHSSAAQYALAGTNGYTRVRDRDDLRPGDLVFQTNDGSSVGHVGVYIGKGRFISATSSEGVQVRSLYDSYWGPRWVGGLRVFERDVKKPARESELAAKPLP